MWVWRKAHEKPGKPPRWPAVLWRQAPPRPAERGGEDVAGKRPADRVGVWELNPSRAIREISAKLQLSGIVADKDGDATPAEWSRLLQRLLYLWNIDRLAKRLSRNRRVSGGPLIGAVSNAERALGLSADHGHLRGVLFGRRSERNTRVCPEHCSSPSRPNWLSSWNSKMSAAKASANQNSRRMLAALGQLGIAERSSGGIVKDGHP